jgi:putative tryptophan/tyrosine transport system substrate-binding protein
LLSDLTILAPCADRNPVKRRAFLGSVLATAILPRGVAAQGAPKAARIGWLTAQQASSLTPYLAAMRAGFSEIGYVEGRNLTIEYRYGDDVIERVPDLAVELVRLGVDLLVVQGAAVSVISQLGLTVPVVYVFSGDPVSAGFADSLARPRGNMTGLTFMAAELNGKRLEMLRDIVPDLRRVAIVANSEHPGAHLEQAYSEDVGRRLGLAIQYFPTPTSDELSRAFAAMSAQPPQAISVFADGFAVQNRKIIIDFAMNHRAPVVSGWSVFAQSGALCTYGPRLADSYRRLAGYVDRILKGAKPADLPIEQPTKFETVINLRTAKTLGLAIPPLLLVSADQVIE